MSARRVAAGWAGSGVLAAALCACTSGQVASIPTAATPNVAESSTLQLGVGTATIGTRTGSSVGLNVVATFRQPNGNNATNVNTPTLRAPAGVNFGPLLGNSNIINGATPAQLAAIASAVRAANPKATPVPVPASFSNGFGPFVGVFGYGLAADNLVSSTDLSTVATLGPFQPGGQLCGRGRHELFRCRDRRERQHLGQRGIRRLLRAAAEYRRPHEQSRPVGRTRAADPQRDQPDLAGLHVPEHLRAARLDLR